MATTIRMPQLGESVAEGTISKWLKQVGDRVEKYEPLVEVITDKVNAELPSPAAGVLQSIAVSEGTTVPVGTEIAVLEEAVARPDGTVAETRQPALAAVGASAVGEDGADAAEGTESAGERRRATPLVRRLAQEHAVDLSLVTGTGPGGRITREDILNYAAQPREATMAPTAPESVTVPPAPPATGGADEEIVAVGPIRRAIAEHMVRSRRTAPHAWTMVEVDVTPLVRYREAVKEEFRRREGVDLTYVPFVIKAVVEALKENPRLNSVWAEDRIVVKKRIHIGVPVALEDGLVVPVIHDADRLSIAALARAVADLAVRARAGKLTVEDVQGGTFTVNNTGAFGSVISAPIINQPQAAILTMEAITRRPVVLGDDAIAVRSIMNVCLSFDHRILDGANVGSFLKAVKKKLEGYGPNTPIY